LNACQWNINCLYGAAADPDLPVEAASIMDVIMPLNADVIFFQESCVLSYSPPSPESSNWWDNLPDSSQRISQLHALLLSAGYHIVQADGCQNPAMIATRLPFASVEPPFIIDVDPFRSGMLAQQPPELRSARLVTLKLGLAEDCPEFIAVVSHLHHKETPETAGLRLAEVRCIMQQLCAAQLSRPWAAAVFATDFNCPRRKDYNEREWRVIAHIKHKLGEVEVDGVAEELEHEGFTCTYGTAAPALTHWSSMTVDFAYFRQPQDSHWRWHSDGSYIISQQDRDALSDHLPVVHDFKIVATSN
jgi:hypothetical protein